MQLFSSKEAGGVEVGGFQWSEWTKSYPTKIHFDFSGIVHRINVRLHEHNQRDLRHGDFQPPLSLSLIK